MVWCFHFYSISLSTYQWRYFKCFF